MGHTSVFLTILDALTADCPDSAADVREAAIYISQLLAQDLLCMLCRAEATVSNMSIRP